MHLPLIVGAPDIIVMVGFTAMIAGTCLYVSFRDGWRALRKRRLLARRLQVAEEMSTPEARVARTAKIMAEFRRRAIRSAREE
jgi:hypothetical protein